KPAGSGSGGNCPHCQGSSGWAAYRRAGAAWPSRRGLLIARGAAGVWAMARYDEVHAALLDWETFCSSAGVGLSNFRTELPAGPEDAGQLGQVREAKAGARVVLRTGVAGVEQVVVAGAGGAELGERVVPGRDGAVHDRVPEPNSVAQVPVDDHGGSIQLRVHETGAALLGHPADRSAVDEVSGLVAPGLTEPTAWAVAGPAGPDRNVVPGSVVAPHAVTNGLSDGVPTARLVVPRSAIAVYAPWSAVDVKAD